VRVINSVGQRVPRLLPWLDERRPEVVCLQETKLADDAFLDLLGDELRDRGYAVAVHGEATWNGVAILSRVGLDDVVGLAGAPGFPRPESRAEHQDLGMRIWYWPARRSPTWTRRRTGTSGQSCRRPPLRCRRAARPSCRSRGKPTRDLPRAVTIALASTAGRSSPRNRGDGPRSAAPSQHSYCVVVPDTVAGAFAWSTAQARA
jgi:hypothetical protein